MPVCDVIMEEEEDALQTSVVHLPPSVNAAPFKSMAPPVWPVGTPDNMFRHMALSVSLLASKGVRDARFSVVANCQNPMCPGIVVGAPVGVPPSIRADGIPAPEYFNVPKSRTVAAFVTIMRTMWETGRETFGADMSRVVGPHQMCECPADHDFSERMGCAFCFRGGRCPMCPTVRPSVGRLGTVVQCLCTSRQSVSSACGVHGMPTMTLMMVPPEHVVEALYGADDDISVGSKRRHSHSGDGDNDSVTSQVVSCIVGAVSSNTTIVGATYRALTNWLDIQAAYNTRIANEVEHVMAVTRAGIMHNGCLRICDSGHAATNSAITTCCLPLRAMLERSVSTSSMAMGASVFSFCEFMCTPMWQQHQQQ